MPESVAPEKHFNRKNEFTSHLQGENYGKKDVKTVFHL